MRTAGYKHNLPVKPIIITGNDRSARREYSMLDNKMDTKGEFGLQQVVPFAKSSNSCI
jgi:hypothetical protein